MTDVGLEGTLSAVAVPVRVTDGFSAWDGDANDLRGDACLDPAGDAVAVAEGTLSAVAVPARASDGFSAWDGGAVPARVSDGFVDCGSLAVGALGLGFALSAKLGSADGVTGGGVSTMFGRMSVCSGEPRGDGSGDGSGEGLGDSRITAVGGSCDHVGRSVSTDADTTDGCSCAVSLFVVPSASG